LMDIIEESMGGMEGSFVVIHIQERIWHQKIIIIIIIIIVEVVIIIVIYNNNNNNNNESLTKHNMHLMILKPPKWISIQSIWMAEFSSWIQNTLFRFHPPKETKPSLIIGSARCLFQEDYGKHNS
jgi:heme/copper-type cytochrome/quinol oxidase subunit 2